METDCLKQVIDRSVNRVRRLEVVYSNKLPEKWAIVSRPYKARATRIRHLRNKPGADASDGQPDSPGRLPLEACL